MKFDFNKKYTTITIYCIITFAIFLLMVLAVFRFDGIVSFFESTMKILSPVIWGLVLAYLLNPVMKSFEKIFKSLTEKKKSHPRLNRRLSVAATSILTLAVLSALIAIVLPQIVSSISSILNNLNSYFSNAEKWVNKLLADNAQINDFINAEFENIQKYATEIVNKFQSQLKNIISELTQGAFSFLIGIKDFFLGFIIMIYLLLSKEKFAGQIKKTLYAFLPGKYCENILSVTRRADSTFIGFISGKALDSLIIGLLCFIAMSLMHMPYAVLISFIIGITNMIPFFGPIIGAIPSGLLVLLSDPKKVIPFVIFVIILQQFDGNILGPKILGDSTGLPAFWVMFAIFVGGGFFGFAGMLLGVPVFAVIYAITRESVEERLKKKSLPVSTEEYITKQDIKEISEENKNEGIDDGN